MTTENQTLVKADQGSLVPVTGGANVVSAQEFFRETPLNVFTSFDVTSEDGKIAIMSLMQSGTSAPIADLLNTEISVEHVLAHTVTLRDEDDKEVLADRIVLIDPDGNAFSAVSGGIRRSLQVLVALWGLPPWKPARTLKAVGVKTRAGWRTFNLVPVAKAKVVETAKK